MLDIKFESDEDLYIVSRWLYSIGEDTISDAEYQNLHRLMLQKNTLPEYVARSWSSDPCPINLLRKYNLNEFVVDIMNSDRTESIPSKTSELEVRQEFSTMDHAYTVSPKFDGFSIVNTYYRHRYVGSRTRGRTADAIDVSRMKFIIPESVDISERRDYIGEATLSDDAFQTLKEMFPEKGLVSQRAAVRTALSSDEGTKLLTFTGFDIAGQHHILDIEQELKRNNFNIPVFRIVHNIDELFSVMAQFDKEHASFTQPTDGLVVRDTLGDYKMAVRIWSWEESVYRSFVSGYKETYNRHLIPMQVEIYPITTSDGRKQEVVNTTNLARIIENHLDVIGSPICFVVKSSATADLDVIATHIQQELYRGRYDTYRKEIMLEENTRHENQYR